MLFEFFLKWGFELQICHVSASLVRPKLPFYHGYVYATTRERLLQGEIHSTSSCQGQQISALYLQCLKALFEWHWSVLEPAWREIQLSHEFIICILSCLSGFTSKANPWKDSGTAMGETGADVSHKQSWLRSWRQAMYIGANMPDWPIRFEARSPFGLLCKSIRKWCLQHLEDMCKKSAWKQSLRLFLS